MARFVLTAMVYCAFALVATADGLELAVKKCAAPPKIDGVLDDACWKTAAEVTEFYLIGQPGDPVKKHKAYVTCDNAWLYIGYEVEQSEKERVAPKYINGHDDYVQRDDCVKVSFDPGTEGKMWYHFKINRANVQNDQRFANGRQEIAGWNIPWKSAVKDNAQNWTAEIALPLCLLYPFDNLENARINLLITCNVAERDPQGVVVSAPKKMLYSWAPLLKGFDECAKFGRIKGLEKLELQAPFLPFIERTSVTPYFQKEGKYLYGIDVDLKPYSATAGKVELALEDTTADGKTQQVKEVLNIAQKSGEIKYSITVPAEALAKRTATLLMTDPGTGEELQKIVFPEEKMQELNLFSGYLDRSYYTSETAAVAVCQVRLPEETLRSMSLKAEDEKGQLITTSSKVAPESLFAIPLESLSVGSHAIRVKLCDNNNREVSALSFTLIKRQPAPGCEWKIDRINRVLLNNGKPFFAMGLVMHKLAVDDYATLHEIAAGNFNFLLLWARATPETMTQYCDNFEKAGLYMMPAIDDMACSTKPVELDCLKKYLQGKDYQTVLPFCNDFTILRCRIMTIPELSNLTKLAKNEIFGEFFNRKVPDVLKLAAAAAKRKCVLGWWIFDEPDTSSFFDQWKFGKEFYDKLNDMDGYHPVGVNYSSHIPEQKEATVWMDILMTDPYWIPAGENRNTPNFVSTIAARTYQRGEEHRQPAWSLPVASLWSGTGKRLITPDEQYCQTYLATIYGATGIMYFAHSTINDKASWEAVCEMARQFKTLGPACVAPAVKQEIIYQSRDTDGKITPIDNNPAAEKFADIQASVKRNPDGGYILMAANSRYYPVKIEVTINGLKTEVSRLFAPDTHPVKNETFIDDFKPFGIRAYRLEQPLQEPVKITITAIPPAKIPLPETSCSWREKHKNEFSNPSFEETSIDGWPDYYLFNLSGRRIGPLVGEKDAGWGIDCNEARFGKKSLRIKTPLSENGAPGWVYWTCAPQNRKAEKYVFSVWLKGSKNGLKVQMQAGFTGAEPKPVVVTDQWQRYDMIGMLPAAANQHTMFRIILQSEGTLWIDGVQLEKGDKPTEFEE